MWKCELFLHIFFAGVENPNSSAGNAVSHHKPRTKVLLSTTVPRTHTPHGQQGYFWPAVKHAETNRETVYTSTIHKHVLNWKNVPLSTSSASLFSALGCVLVCELDGKLQTPIRQRACSPAGKVKQETTEDFGSPPLALSLPPSVCEFSICGAQ